MTIDSLVLSRENYIEHWTNGFMPTAKTAGGFTDKAIGSKQQYIMHKFLSLSHKNLSTA